MTCKHNVGHCPDCMLEALQDRNNVFTARLVAAQCEVAKLRNQMEKSEPMIAKREWVDQQALKAVRELNKELGISGMIGSPNWYDVMRKAFAAPAVPTGYKLVPIEPTRQMLEDAYMEIGAYDQYKAMLKAAPKGETL